MLHLRPPGHGERQQGLGQLVGRVGDQQEQLVGPVQGRADRVGIQQVADGDSAPTGNLASLFRVKTRTDAPRLSSALTTSVPTLPVPQVTRTFMRASFG